MEAEGAFNEAREIAITIQSDTQQASIESRPTDMSFLWPETTAAVSHQEEAIRLNPDAA